MGIWIRRLRRLCAEKGSANVCEYWGGDGGSSRVGQWYFEAVYQAALEREFLLQGIAYEREKHLSVHYRGEVIAAYRADFVCSGQVIVELKALQKISGTEEARVINYLKATGLQCGSLINFGARSLGYKRLVFDLRQSAQSAN